MAMQDRKVRRAIANGNERRRMQSINAGFEKLKELICPEDKEKLSKASVLHQAVDYIYKLEERNQRLMSNNARLKRILRSLGRDAEIVSSDDDDASVPRRPPSSKRRRKQDTESSDEGFGGGGVLTLADVVSFDNTRQENVELRRKLELERLRLDVEERCRQLMESSEVTNKSVQNWSNVTVEPTGGKYACNNNIDLTSGKNTITETVYGFPRIESSSKDAVVFPLTCEMDGQTFIPTSQGDLESIVEAITRLEDARLPDCLTTITAENEKIKNNDFVAEFRQKEVVFTTKNEIRDESFSESKCINEGSGVCFESANFEYEEVSSPTRKRSETQLVISAAEILQNLSWGSRWWKGSLVQAQSEGVVEST